MRFRLCLGVLCYILVVFGEGQVAFRLHLGVALLTGS